MDGEEATKMMFDERDELLANFEEAEGGEGNSAGSGEKSKVIDNATNMTELNLSFEIEEIELKVSQVWLQKYNRYSISCVI